jgi:hypothetical protein
MGWRETAALPAKSSWRATAAKAAPTGVADLRAKDDSPPVIDPLEGEVAPEPPFVDKAVKALKPYLDPKTQTGAAARGISQGVTLGYGDEMMGLLDTAGQRLGLGGAEPEVREADPLDKEPPAAADDAELYRRTRDRFRADNAVARAAHPKTFVGSEILGSLAIPVPGSSAVKGASILAKAKAAAPGAIALGAGYGLGKSDAELTGDDTELLRAMKDTAIGGAAGGAGAAAGAVVGRGVEKLGTFFGKKAGDAGAKAVGFRAGIANQAENMGKTAEEMAEMGNAARKAGLIPFAGSKESVGLRAAAKLSQDGETIGKVYDELGASGVPADLGQIAQDASLNVAAKYARDPKTGQVILDSLGRPVRIHQLPAPDQVRNMGLANKHLNDFVEAGQQSPGAEGWRLAQQMKTRAQATVNPKPDAPLAHELHEDAVQGTTRAIENRVGNILGPARQGDLIAANKGYGLAKDVSELARKAATREQALQKPSFTSPLALTAAGSAATGVSSVTGSGSLGAIAGTLGLATPYLKDFVVKRGAAVSTHAFGALEDLLKAGGDKVPELFGRAGAQVAAQTSADERLRAHRELMATDPGYAKAVADFLESEAEHAFNGDVDGSEKLQSYFSGR